MKKITSEQFDAKLIEIISEMNAAQLISISGVYEILSEEFNNDVIDAINEDRANQKINYFQ